MKIVILFFISICCSCIYAKDINAITDDGKKVTLHENGKWEFISKTEKKIDIKSDFSFKKTYWGMSKAQVKKTETGKIIQDDSTLAYEANIAGLATYIVYIFVEDQLVRTRYVFVENHSNKTDYLSDYNSIQKILNKKYGNPIEEKTHWKNDLYKDDYQDWGLALAFGHLLKFSEWKFPDTVVRLVIDGDNLKIRHSTEYYSISLANLEKEKTEADKAKLF